MEIDYSKVPVDYMVGAVQRYIEKGILPGGFLTSVLCNESLSHVVARADRENQRVLAEWVVFLTNDVPGQCWGNPELVDSWCRMGGLEGMYAQENG